MGSDVLVVAELGINHQGNVETALKMVEAAADAGCDAIKIQVFHADEFCSESARYEGRSQREMFRQYELSKSAIDEIWQCAREHDLMTVATVTSRLAIDMLDARPPTYLKIGSDDLTNAELLRLARRTPPPKILSTGMATEREIVRACEILEPSYLLHCVSLYPCPATAANLWRMLALKRLGVARWVGYSDHTEGHEAAISAVALGASLVEKHFTLDRSMEGPDHRFSETPESMAQLVRSIRVAEAMRGDGLIDPQPAEGRMRAIARRKVVALVSGEQTLTREMLTLQRAEGGDFDAGEIESLLGRRAILRAGEALREGDLE